MARTSSTSDVLLYLLAILLPPVPVFLCRGCGADFLINIGLSILGWIPGTIRKFSWALHTNHFSVP
ncbi:plasma membrane proteolipid Pmp3 [Pyricularia grisea]|nr:plasma membrane proteolipid Pmp3 [Pyricularia grisea]